MSAASRIVGVRHRVKKTAKGEARPTQLAILSEGKKGKEVVVTRELETETDEIDWMRGSFPIEFRAITEEDDLSTYQPHHLKWRKLKKGEKITEQLLNVQRVAKKDENIWSIPTKVPTAFDGLKAGDMVAATLGGSGDRFTFALSKQADKLGSETRVMRIPPAVLKDNRALDKEEDAINLARLIQEKPALFRECTARDRELIRLTEVWRSRVDAMKDRIACEQRLRTRYLGKVFLTEDGNYPEGVIEDIFDEAKANDKILLALTTAQKEIEVDLERVLKNLPVYMQLFVPIKGVGPAIAARLIVAIGDIRKYEGGAPVLDDRIEGYRAEIRRLKELANFDEDLDKVAEHRRDDDKSRRTTQLVRSWKRRNGKEAEALLLDQALEVYEQIKVYKRDVARRSGPARLKAALGAHVARGGRHGDTAPGEQFPRHRTGERGNWSKEGRQALYLLGEQFNRRPESPWGQLLLAIKAKMRKIHGKGAAIEVAKEVKDLFRATEQFFHDHGVYTVPTDNRVATTDEFRAWMDAAKAELFDIEAVENREDLGIDEARLLERCAMIEEALDKIEIGKKPKLVKLYSNGHIHKMALWRTATRFVEWLFKAWMAIENGGAVPKMPGRTIIAEWASSAASEESEAMSEATESEGDSASA